MTLLEKINNDIFLATKNKDYLTLNVVRLLQGAIHLEKINKNQELTSEEIMDVISKQIKMRYRQIQKCNDSLDKFNNFNLQELIDKNLQEIAILSTYIPEQLSLEEINKIIDEAFNTVNPTSSKDMGLIMKEVSPKLKGRTDMGKVSNIIKDRLANL